MIDAYARNNRLEKALKMVEQMRNEGQKPSSVIRHILFSQSKKQAMLPQFFEAFNETGVPESYTTYI